MPEKEYIIKSRAFVNYFLCIFHIMNQCICIDQREFLNYMPEINLNYNFFSKFNYLFPSESESELEALKSSESESEEELEPEPEPEAEPEPDPELDEREDIFSAWLPFNKQVKKKLPTPSRINAPFDLYVDAVRFLPDNATVVKVCVNAYYHI